MKDKKTVWKVRNTIRLLLGIGTFSIGLSLFSFDSFAVEGKVKPRSAKIREEANTTSEALASVEAGDELSIKGKVKGTEGDEWYQVFVNKDTLGFIRADLVDPDGTVSEIQIASAAPAESTDIETIDLAANTGQTAGEIEQMQNQNANVTGGDVNVRASASTSSNKLAKAPNGTAMIVSGKTTGADGKIWYQVSLTVDGNEVSGFIRSDYVALGDVIPEPEPEPEAPSEPEPEPEAPSEPEESKAYDTAQETKEDGTMEWYLYDYEAGLKYPISQLLDAAKEYETFEKQIGQQKIIILAMVVVIVILILGVTLLLFKLKDSSMDDDDEDEMNYEEAPVRRKRSVNEGGTPVRRTAQGESRPVRRSVQEGERPVRRTVQEGERPVRRTAQEGQTRPKQGSRPVQRTQSGEPVRRKTTQGTRPRTTAPRPQEREVVYQDEPEMNNGKDQNGAWRSKNFLTDEDEFEFEFLNMDDPNKL